MARIRAISTRGTSYYYCDFSFSAGLLVFVGGGGGGGGALPPLHGTFVSPHPWDSTTTTKNCACSTCLTLYL